MFVPAAPAGVDQPFTFDVDRVTIVPNPPVVALLARSGLLLAQAPPPTTATAKSHGPTANCPPYVRAVMPGDGLSLEAGAARALDDMGSANSRTFVSVSE